MALVSSSAPVRWPRVEGHVKRFRVRQLTTGGQQIQDGQMRCLGSRAQLALRAIRVVASPASAPVGLWKLERCPDPAFPYRLTVTEAGRQAPTLVLRSKDPWPGAAKYTFCLRATEPPAADEEREEAAVHRC
jgi:hypothetical protein